MANLRSAVVEVSSSRVLLADNNAHPNPASSLQNEVLGIGLNGKGRGWVDWAGFGVKQIPNSFIYKRPPTSTDENLSMFKFCSQYSILVVFYIIIVSKGLQLENLPQRSQNHLVIY